jgi:hypothetical protein
MVKYISLQNKKNRLQIAYPSPYKISGLFMAIQSFMKIKLLISTISMYIIESMDR